MGPCSHRSPTPIGGVPLPEGRPYARGQDEQQQHMLVQNVLDIMRGGAQAAEPQQGKAQLPAQPSPAAGMKRLRTTLC